jgi:CheY-like chemotaxis protein
VVVIYAAVALTWIFASDRVVEALSRDIQSATLYSSLKGAAFVGVTSLLLLVLIRRLLARTEAADLRARQADDRRREVETELEKERRLDGLGRIASGVAYDLGALMEPLNGLLVRLHESGRTPDRKDMEVVRSAVGRGTELVRGMLLLGGPSVPDQPRKSSASDPLGAEKAPRPDVLVVEDEAAIRMFVREWMETSGYRVAAASSVGELRQLQRSGMPGPRALVMDWCLDDDRPEAVSEQVRSWSPDVRCVVISGQMVSPEELERVAGGKFLLKPFAGRDLVEALESLGIRPDQPRSGFQRGFFDDMSTL